LARDLAEAKSAGFDVVHVGVFDLMPMTSQIEVVATLTRGKPGFAGREQRVGPGGQLEKEGGRG
jgi:hypothetical protein